MNRWIEGYYFEVNGRAFIVPDDAEIRNEGCASAGEYLTGFVEVEPSHLFRRHCLVAKSIKESGEMIKGGFLPSCSNCAERSGEDE